MSRCCCCWPLLLLHSSFTFTVSSNSMKCIYLNWTSFFFGSVSLFIGSFLFLHHSFRKGKKRNLLGVPHHFHNSTANKWKKKLCVTFTFWLSECFIESRYEPLCADLFKSHRFSSHFISYLGWIVTLAGKSLCLSSGTQVNTNQTWSFHLLNHF